MKAAGRGGGFLGSTPRRGGRVAGRGSPRLKFTKVRLPSAPTPPLKNRGGSGTPRWPFSENSTPIAAVPEAGERSRPEAGVAFRFSAQPELA